MLVHVLGMDGDPLDPTHPAKARILLKRKKAKVVRRLPFTIKLTYEIKNPKTQKYTLGVDTGFSKLGTAVINEKDEVIYLSEVTLRNDIKKIMKNRSETRRARTTIKAVTIEDYTEKIQKYHNACFVKL